MGEDATQPPGRSPADTAPERLASRVPGLELRRRDSGDHWRLVHGPSGLLLSRAAVSAVPEPLLRLADALGELADWSKPEIGISGPVLRKAIEEAATGIGLPLRAPERDSAGPAASAEADRELLRLVLSRVHTAVPPAVLAAATGDLGPDERARLQALLTEDAGAAIRPLSATPARGTQRMPEAEGQGSAAG